MFDLASLITEDLGEPQRRGSRLYWPCPFHADDTPSLTIVPGGKRWKCFGCELAGGAVSWLMKKRGLDEPEAYEMAEEMGLADGWDHTDALGRPRGRKRPKARRSPPKPAPVAPRDAQGPPAAWSKRAAAFATYAQGQLWGEADKTALAYLHERGLEDETIKAWGLGWNSADRWDRPGRWGLEPGKKVWLPRGVVIPCEVEGATWYVKVRRFDAGGPLGSGQKYAQARGGKPALYGLDHLDGKRAAVICEGELDAILLHQEASDLADVVAIGGKAAHPALPFLARLAGATRWLVALDGDADDAAGWWGDYTARVRRVRPLQGNDVTDFHQAGGDLRAWMEYHLRRLLVTGPVAEGHAQGGPQGDGTAGNLIKPKIAAETSPRAAQGGGDGGEWRKMADFPRLSARATAQDPLPTDELEALLAELEAATGSTDERIDALMARWDALNEAGNPGGYPPVAVKGDTKPGEPATYGGNGACAGGPGKHGVSARAGATGCERGGGAGFVSKGRPGGPPPLEPCGWPGGGLGRHRRFWRPLEAVNIGWVCATCHPAPEGVAVETWTIPAMDID